MPDHLPVTRFSVTHGPVTLACARFGAGPPLVCVHALGFSKEYFVAAAEVLGRHFDCIAYDQRGHGETVAPLAAAAFTPAAFAADLGAVLDALGLAAASVGGISLGAATTLVFALGAPGRVRQLVQDLPAFGPGPARSRLHGDGVAVALAAGDLAAAAQAATAGLGQAPARALAALLAAQWAQVPAAELGPKLAFAFRATAGWQIGADPAAPLGRLEVPTEVLGLAGDPLHPLAVAESLVAALPRARLWRRVPSLQPTAVARQWVDVLTPPR
jgi:3-oxoadipate enol-lactonase/4-carboxymuconolactone decarboxylase